MAERLMQKPQTVKARDKNEKDGEERKVPELSEFTKMENQIEKERAAVARAEEERKARQAAKNLALVAREKDRKQRMI